ncbi:MAG: CRTAC1 family protein, partial [Acidobacteriaceae bacterium]|nr:CRTAC1 family protein [Acidobacteriaceae bacterium]
MPSAILQASYTGAWAFDIDLDGDLDVVLGVRAGDPIVLRNNGDGSYAVIKPFEGVDGLLDFASADVDGDGDPDVALLDKQGRLKVFANERLGDYKLRHTPVQLSGQALKLAAADVNGDGLPDFVILQSDFRVMSLADHGAGRDWRVAELARAKPRDRTSAPPSLALADLDNNGALDLVVNDQVYLSDGQSFKALSNRLPAISRGFVEANANGRLNVIGLSADGRGLEGVNIGTKPYHWQDVRPRAAATNGDQRINSFGIGGEIQIRSELLTQQQIIESPLLHFGLGTHSGAEFARIVWPNGLIQTEFALKANQTLVAEQRLKGSCPLLFTWNGHAMQFAKDVAPMSAALGAHDSSGHFASISQTEEWFKIDGEQLKPRDGFYDLRVTDEYWETYYIDHYALLTLDHPTGTQIYVDERVSTPVAPLKIYITGEPRAFRSAIDDRGKDVSAVVQDLDRKYLDTFGLGPYQGVARDHWLQLELPPEAPQHGALYLIGQGWLHPWDDGILVAASQNSQTRLRDMSVEVPDRNGHWIEVRSNLGVPAGREKTVALNLTGIFRVGAPRKLRLHTNLEIYWDKLAWATGASHKGVKTQQMPLTKADLRHRGYSQITESKTPAPEVPDYDELSDSGGKWPSLEGYYTRYGDVRPLLEKADDRFVIATGGDELRLQFCAIPAPPKGWSRDFIFVGDGWMKEGDYSFKYSTTVLPLPYHLMRAYTGPVTTLEND